MCCGHPRPKRPAPAPGSPPTSPPVTLSGVSLARPVFEYTGATALTIVSPVTRKTYRFDRPGARLEVDIRDRSWVAFIPNLTRAPSA